MLNIESPKTQEISLGLHLATIWFDNIFVLFLHFDPVNSVHCLDFRILEKFPNICSGLFV
jgi:hypothetical protein